MHNTLHLNTITHPSICDYSGKMGIPGIFDLFQDIATEHAEMIGVGFEDMKKKNLIWIALRAKIKFNRIPIIMEKIDLETWPGHPVKIRCPRFYRISSNGDILAEGKTEWGIIDLNTGRLRNPMNIFPPELEIREEEAITEPFTKINEDFSNDKTIDTFRVSSSDLDYAGHMNNAAYIRRLFGAFSCDFLKERNILSTEVNYIKACHENDKIDIKIREKEETIEAALVMENGKSAVTAILR